MQELVRRVTAVQALGTGHSSNAISDCAGVQLRLDRMFAAITINIQDMTVSVGGSTYGALGTWRHGFASEQLREVGSWRDRLSHFQMDFMPSAGAEIQSEYLVDHVHAVAARQALRSLAEVMTSLLQVAEIRTVAADDLWLSTAEGRAGAFCALRPGPGWHLGAQPCRP